MMKYAANAVRNIESAEDPASQPEVHRWLDNVERSLEILGDSAKRLNERLYYVLENTPTGENEPHLRTSHLTPMVERLSTIKESVDAINAMTVDILSRIQI
ncbi:hypothetical protein QF001_000885 [Paraburkholderia youngii]|uniref:hypothetical protein n=1 Tax=Paraburkholderia youngii TaxID=2782701 RepID=UPI003D1F3990